VDSVRALTYYAAKMLAGKGEDNSHADDVSKAFFRGNYLGIKKEEATKAATLEWVWSVLICLVEENAGVLLKKRETKYRKGLVKRGQLSVDGQCRKSPDIGSCTE